MIQAIGSPTRMSMTVTISAMLNELATALMTVFLMPSSFRTWSTRPQSVNMWVTTNMDGIAMTTTNTAHANANHALRTFELPESSSILFRRDKGAPPSENRYAYDVASTQDDLSETPAVRTLGP